MDKDFINSRIRKEICYETLNILKDENLISEYKNCSSVKKNIELLQNILKNKNIDTNIIQNIIDEYIFHLIPAGTKGVIRGNKFNDIVKKIIKNLEFDEKEFEVCFEKHSDIFITDEKPDWYIYKKSDNKIIIGMNQLDLWNGGQQINRGYKYLVDIQSNDKNKKQICVVCNKT